MNWFSVHLPTVSEPLFPVIAAIGGMVGTCADLRRLTIGILLRAGRAIPAATDIALRWASGSAGQPRADCAQDLPDGAGDY